MNPKLDLVFARRSIRHYQERDIPRSLIRDILEAAMAAPSAVCKDPWHFIVLRDKSTLASVAECLPNGKMFATGPVGLVVCGDLQQAHDGELSYLLQDCSAAIQNALLAASALGLGACWLGVCPRVDRITHIRRLFALPDHILPVACIALGWPEEEKAPRTRYRDAAVHPDQW